MKTPSGSRPPPRDGLPAAAAPERSQRAPLYVRLAAVAAAWAAAFGLTLALAPFIQRANFVLFWIAVLFAAWYAGFWPALIAAVGAVAAVTYYLVPPIHSFVLLDLPNTLTLAIFAGASATVSALASSLAKQKRLAEERAHELALRADELQDQALELEEQAQELEQQTETAQDLAAELEGKTVEARRGESRLKGILDSMPDVELVYDRDWRFVYMNGAGEQLIRVLGRDPAAMAGRRVWDEFPELRGTKFYTESVTAVEENRVVEFEEYSAGDGRWYENRIVPIPDGVVTYSRDVTERRESDQRLRESEARFRGMFSESATPMWIFDVETLRFLDVNDAAVRQYGYSREEFLSMTIADIRPREDVQSLVDAMRGRPSEGPVVRGRFRHLWKDGSLRDVNVATQDTTFGGRRARLTIITDETDRLRAEARERLLAEASRLLGASLDVDESLRQVARLAVPGLADWCGIELLNDAGELEQIAVAHADLKLVEKAWEIRRRFAPPADAPGGPPAVARTGRSRLVSVVTDDMLVASAYDEEHLRRMREIGIHSQLMVPVAAAADRTLGVLVLVCSDPACRLTEADLSLAEELGRRIGLAVDNARLYAAEKEARRAAERVATRMERLQAVTAALSATLTPEEVARVVVDHGIAALGARAGSVAMLDESARRLELLDAVGYPADLVERFRRIPLDADYPLAEAARTGELIISRSAEDRDERWPQLAALRTESRRDPIAAIPLSVRGHRVGVLGISFPAGAALDGDDTQLLLAFAQQCAQALERARLYVAERAARGEAERERREAQLQRGEAQAAQRLAEAANRAKSDFLATMSHELRTPLNAIAGYAELLTMGIRGPVTDTQREDLMRIQKSQRHLLSLVNDVLNFARIDAGRVHYDVADVPLHEVLADVGALVTPQLSAKGLAYEADGASGDGAEALTVRADREKVAQILLNLLSNAIKFTPPGGRVSVACDERDGDVLVRVSDTGIGIPEEQRDAIFEPFVQVQRGLTRTAEGTGLGLAISRDLARAMRGDIAVESAPGAGSTFTLALPRGE